MPNVRHHFLPITSTRLLSAPRICPLSGRMARASGLPRNQNINNSQTMRNKLFAHTQSAPLKLARTLRDRNHINIVRPAPGGRCRCVFNYQSSLDEKERVLVACVRLAVIVCIVLHTLATPMYVAYVHADARFKLSPFWNSNTNHYRTEM